MSEISRIKAIKAVMSGRAQVIDLNTYARFEGKEVLRINIQAIIFPGVQAVNEIKLSAGKGNRGVLRRDSHRCQYCGGHGNTVDHVIPKCQKGQSTWLNLVACCFACNQKKRGRTPLEANMTLLKQPISPRAVLWEKFYTLVNSKKSVNMSNGVLHCV
jgi:hypothetical protein